MAETNLSNVGQQHSRKAQEKANNNYVQSLERVQAIFRSYSAVLFTPRKAEKDRSLTQPKRVAMGDLIFAALEFEHEQTLLQQPTEAKNENHH